MICAATVAELTGSIIWGVYSYRLGNLPTFVPPAHGLVFMAGLSLSEALGDDRALVVVAAAIAATWGVLGLTVLPRTDAAGALGVPLLLVFLWRSSARASYAGVFLVVAALELYGTAIGTWRWAERVPGLGIPDGNPPSGVASGYVWFDVMALLLARASSRACDRTCVRGGTSRGLTQARSGQNGACHTRRPWRNPRGRRRRMWAAAPHDPPGTQHEAESGFGTPPGG